MDLYGLASLASLSKKETARCSCLKPEIQYLDCLTFVHRLYLPYIAVFWISACTLSWKLNLCPEVHFISELLRPDIVLMDTATQRPDNEMRSCEQFGNQQNL